MCQRVQLKDSRYIHGNPDCLFLLRSTKFDSSFVHIAIEVLLITMYRLPDDNCGDYIISRDRFSKDLCGTRSLDGIIHISLIHFIHFSLDDTRCYFVGTKLVYKVGVIS